LAFDLAPVGIGILVLHPGWVKTDMGGPDATMDREASVCEMRRVIRDFSAADSGTFRNYNGGALPW
jgi:NAD(P)-dependent dehydrogenase (short-subunit alcohol dehydrogenase family)